MPWFGLGVFKVEEGPELVEAVKSAIKAGYRKDRYSRTYGNEKAVGEGIRAGIEATGIAREELFITQKYGTQIKGMKQQSSIRRESKN